MERRRPRLRPPLALFAAIAVALGGAPATDAYDDDLTELVRTVETAVRTRRIDRTLFDAIAATGDRLYVAPLIDVAYFFPQGPYGEVLSETLTALTGEERSWSEHFRWAGREDIALPPGYDRYKGLLYATFLATWLPARRASRVDPVEFLKVN